MTTSGRIKNPSVSSSSVAVDGSELTICDGVAAAIGAAIGAVVGAAIGAAVAAVGATVGAVVGAAVGAALAASVGAGVAVAAALHDVRVIASLMRVTAPFRARARPFTLTPLFIVIDVRARMVPVNVELDPSVAELVTCQKMLHGCAPLIRLTELDDAVMRSDVAWKIQTELGSF